AHLENGDSRGLPQRELGRELMVGRLPSRQRQLVVEVVTRQFREAARANLEPLVGAVWPLAWPAHTDPASHVAVEDVEAAERRHSGRDSERRRGCGKTGVAVAAGAAGER